MNNVTQILKKELPNINSWTFWYVLSEEIDKQSRRISTLSFTPISKAREALAEAYGAKDWFSLMRLCQLNMELPPPRVGCSDKLKLKAAMKNAFVINDETPFEPLPWDEEVEVVILPFKKNTDCNGNYQE